MLLVKILHEMSLRVTDILHDFRHHVKNNLLREVMMKKNVNEDQTNVNESLDVSQKMTHQL
jgi:hypothetical protein